jgi:L-threonylcarbamoyladenylate synthase
LLVDLIQAKNKLKSGDVVAIPTETVYGLAADITQRNAIELIFKTKNRPFFDPLIVHLDHINKVKKLTTEWTMAHDILANKFWPGPLTLILKKNSIVDDMITSGLDSVGVRIPDHKLTLKLLEDFELGLAAPSANKFGKTSPTSAEHVLVEFEQNVSVLDGGACLVGIESTVCEIVKSKVLIYRPGIISPSMLKQVLPDYDIELTSSPVAPGQIKHHYMPNIPIAIIDNDKEILSYSELKHFKKPIELVLNQDPNLAARELYQKFRELSLNADLIYYKKTSLFESEVFMGIKNRLIKAASFRF